MPSQIKYIVEACSALFLAIVTVKTFQFFSHANLVSNPSSIVVDADPALKNSTKNSEGKLLFVNNCARCHSITRKIVGPPLAGVTERVPDKELLLSWVKNNRKVLQSGDPYFNNLFEQYNRFPMDAFPQLSDRQIEAILNYVEGK